MSLADWQALDARQQGAFRATTMQQLRDAGAHYVVDSVAESLPVIDAIEVRMWAGARA